MYRIRLHPKAWHASTKDNASLSNYAALIASDHPRFHFGTNSRLMFQDLKLLKNLHHKSLKFFSKTDFTFMRSHQTTKQRVQF